MTQAAIEHACQLTVERSRHEFLAGLHDQLRRAQARVIAHMRMENRNLLKMWSLKIRKDFVTWMANAQTELHQGMDFLKELDERGRKCEASQFGILDVVQRQMISLEHKFAELKDQ